MEHYNLYGGGKTPSLVKPCRIERAPALDEAPDNRGLMATGGAQ
jgi:hypothetical protein